MTGEMYRQPGQPDIIRHGQACCPYCRKPVDAASPPDGKPGPAPTTGDFALCFGCGEPAVYEVVAGVVELRKASAAEREECLTQNAEAVANLRAFLSRRRRGAP
jgi:hypothetical protein